MVSKVAVMAIVGIVAIPILLGYAFNINEVTETDYKASGDEINVTPLLRNGTEYTYTKADIFRLNSVFTGYTRTFPDYDTSSTKSSLFLDRQVLDASKPSDVQLYDMNYYSLTVTGYGQYGDYITASIYEVAPDNTETLVRTATQVRSIYYDDGSKTITVTYGNLLGQYTHTFNKMIIKYSMNGTFTGTCTIQQWSKSADLNDPYWVDLSKGYQFDFDSISVYSGENYTNTSITFPGYTRYAIITIDLDSITEDNYAFGITNNCYLEKTTVDDVVSWQVKPRPRIADNDFPVTDLYYDQNSTNNTYQVKIWIDPEGTPYTDIPGYNTYTKHYEFRYVGAWPTLIGEANYYKIIEAECTYLATTPDFKSIWLGGFSDHSPTVRVDDAEFRAMEFLIINDQIYDAASIKTNPMTTINTVDIMGKSIEFGGNIYTVSKGSITLGTHQIPVKGLVLSSVPNGNGEYDNKIGDTVISTTAAPSAITFNGKWSASISTIGQEQYEYTKTEWIAGGFAWNGMDQSFLMVGLITSLGVFIALGIYARRSRASIWPLMLVCGGAAFLFFIMI